MWLYKKKYQKEINDLSNFKSADLLLADKKQEIRNDLMIKIAKLNAQSRSENISFSHSFSFRMFWYSLPLVLIFALTTTVYASNSALPGEWLFPVKLTAEKIQLKLSPTEEIKLKAQDRQASKRLEELSVVKEEKLEIAEKNVEQTITKLKLTQEKLKSENKEKAVENIDRVIKKLENGLFESKSRIRINHERDYRIKKDEKQTEHPNEEESEHNVNERREDRDKDNTFINSENSNPDFRLELESR